MKILVMSDLHYWDENEISGIQSIDYDICLLLGDISLQTIKTIVFYNSDKPIYGVCGNHDDWDTLKKSGIYDLHGKCISFGGVKIAGIAGSHRYKSGDYPMLTQKESIGICKYIPQADILISHDTMYKLYGKDITHIGLKGITQYIRKNNIKLNICGHYHSGDVVKKYGCLVVNVFRCCLIKYPDIVIEKIF